MTTNGGPSPSVARFVRGVGRCAARGPALAAALGPLGWPRTVERLALQVGLAEQRGARRTVAHRRTLLALLGHEDVACHARPAAHGIPTAEEAAVRHRRLPALVALADLSAEVDRALDVLAGPTRHRHDSARVAEAVLIAAMAAPVRAPSAALSILARAVVGSAPPLPQVVRTTHLRGNLLTDLVAEALPGALASAPLRHVVHRLRRPLVVGIRVGRVGTTVSVDRHALRIRNGISRRVHVVLEGGVEPLLRRAAGRVEAEVTGLEAR